MKYVVVDFYEGAEIVGKAETIKRLWKLPDSIRKIQTVNVPLGLVRFQTTHMIHFFDVHRKKPLSE